MNRVVFAVLLCSCLDLTLPNPPPPPGPGTVQGTVVYAVAGRSNSKPAGGARVSLVNTTIETTADLESGRFVLEGITTTTGQIRITFDADKDGEIDRQKLLDLASLKAGPGRDVALGDVTLGRNAEVSGRVLLADVFTPNGHVGTTVFVPSAPFVAVTADDGSFVLENLPEGPTEIGFFRPGYVLETREVDLAGGQEARLTTVTLSMSTTSSTSNLTGTARLSDGTPAANAQVRIAANGVEYTTTTDSEGRFTFINVPTGVYQLAVELDGAKSLRVYNVIVGDEDADMGQLTLSRGTSSEVVLDGGLRLDDLPPIARITQRNLRLAPGTLAVIDGLSSAGEPPLIFHWRSDAGVTFSNNDSADAGSTQITAPLVAQNGPISLTVTDARGRTSVPTFEPLRVGSPPVAVIAPGPASVTSGTRVTLDGTDSLSSDSQGIVRYTWRRTAGPTVPELVLATASSVTFTAPTVRGDVDLVVTLIVENATGFESIAAERTIRITPTAAWSVTAAVTQGSPIVVTNKTTPVNLTATLTSPQAGPSFKWSPSGSCTVPDGGSCGIRGFSIANPNQQNVSFMAPVDDLTQLFTVEATVGGVTQSASVTVRFEDQHQPTCDAGVSLLALRIECDYEMGSGGTVIGLTNLSPIQVDPDDPKRLIAPFVKPPTPGSTPSVQISDLIDQWGKRPVPVSKMAAVEYTPNHQYRSMGTSEQEPRPGWVRFTGNTFGRPANRIVGRRVATSNSMPQRMIWAMPVDNPGCVTEPCVVLDQTFQQIPGAGTTPNGTTAVTIGGIALAMISSSSPVSIWELRPQQAAETWVEIPPSPLVEPAYALGSDGTQFSLIAPATVGPGLNRFTYDAGTVSWGFADIVDPIGTYGANSRAVINSGGKVPFAVIATDNARVVKRFTLGSTWSSTPVVVPATDEVRAVSSEGSSLIFYTDSSGNLYATNHTGSFNAPLFPGAPVDGFDAVAWGQTVLVTYAHNGHIYLSLWDPTNRELSEIVPNATTNHWNYVDDPSFIYGERPQLTLLGDQVGLTWQEAESGGGYRMAGRYVR